MKKIIFVLLFIFVSCTKSEMLYTEHTPLSTSEWHACYTECEVSMPANLKKFGFSAEEIEKIDVKAKCVTFCRKSLYMKRGVALD